MSMPRPAASLLLVLLCWSTLCVEAQSPAFGAETEAARTRSAFLRQATALGAARGSEWVPVRRSVSRGVRQTQHHAYAQRIDGREVVGGVLIYHVPAQAGAEATVTGRPYPAPRGRIAELGEAAAVRRALAVARERDGSHGPRPAGYAARDARLVYVDADFPRRTGRLRLAYAVDLHRDRPRARRRVYVDATDGTLLGEHSLLYPGGVPGSVATRYSGRRAVTVDSVAPGRFALRDPDRGITVTSGALDGEVPTSPTPAFEVDGAAFGAMAHDVFFGAARFYDLFADSLGWRGLDGAGEALVARVDDADGEGYVNAYWNGTNAAFGQGDCHYTPLTTLDVVGHEFMHGVTDRTSDLIYAGESGALNEGLSDIFGKALERIVAPERFTWALGNGFADSDYAEDFRSMADPHLHENPRVYGGEYWADDNGVHTNSGPLGHWFYLLVEGGAGTNELGDDYDVAAIDLYAALRVAFATTRDYLTPAADYREARAGSLLAAAEAYGDSSAVYRSVAQAWRAIGVAGGVDSVETPPTVDLRLLTRNQPRSCGDTYGLNIELEMENPGEATLSPGTVIPFELYVGGEVGYGSWEVDWPIGPEYFFTAEVPIALSLEPGTYDATFVVAFPGDDDAGNDTLRTELEVLTPGRRVRAAWGGWQDGDCRAEARQLNVSFTLAACGVEAGSDLILELRDADDAVTGTLELTDRELYAGYNRLEVDVPLADAAAAESVRVVVGPHAPEHEGDVVHASPPSRSALRVGTVLGFDSRDDPAQPTLDALGWAPGFLGPVGLAPGDTLLAATGADHYGLPCLDPADNFASPWVTRLSVCVDYAGTPSPELAFDVLQLHGEAPGGFDALVAGARALRVGYEEGGEVRYTDIAGTGDGERRRESMFLPDDYTGALYVEAYNAVGSTYEFESGADPDFERFDYTMLDDLGVRDRSSATEEVDAGYVLAPNPASEYLSLSAPAGTRERVEVFSAVARRVYAGWTVPGGQLAIETEGWSSGVYTVTVHADDQVVMRRRVIVQH